MTVRPPADTVVAGADLQQQVLDFLDGSSFGPARGGKRIDTHISMVFLGADRALKIKRAVRLPFLDYSTLENAVYYTMRGYNVEDLTGDGTVESSDYSLIENNVYYTIISMHP